VTSAEGYSGEVATGNSVSVHANWVKSSYSAQNGNCVEAAVLSDGNVGVRDSKNKAPGCPVLVFSRGEWRSFLETLRTGEFHTL
jgi:hypothetical protein